METATIREVQHNLAACVRMVEHGQEIEIRRRNRVVARLVPATALEPPARNPRWGEVRERLGGAAGTIREKRARYGAGRRRLRAGT